jgi:repressor LexA
MRRDLESAPTQQRVLTEILDASERGEPPPTLEELTKKLGQAAKSNIHRALKELKRKDYIEWDRAKSRVRSRTIRPTGKALALRSPEQEPEQAPKVVSLVGELTKDADARLVPLLSKVAAGQPILAEENVRDYLPLPDRHVRGAEVFMLEVKGDSMNGDGVLEGDYVVVESNRAPGDGEMVVALVDGEAVVKRLWHEDGGISLVSTNPAYEPIKPTGENDVEIKGKVIALVRWHIRYRSRNDPSIG